MTLNNSHHNQISIIIPTYNELENIELIQQTLKNAIGNRKFYICNECGFKARQFHWQCPACNSWESLPSEPTDIILDE